MRTHRSDPRPPLPNRPPHRLRRRILTTVVAFTSVAVLGGAIGPAPLTSLAVTSTGTGAGTGVERTGSTSAGATTDSAGLPLAAAQRGPVVNPAPITAPGDRRPNIVLISSDDQRLDEMRFLPKTNKILGEAGITFTQAITPHPLCCPARAEIMSGQYAQNNGVRTNFPPEGGYKAYDPDHTIGTWLSAAGYNTAFVGKPLNGYGKRDGVDPGWTLWDATTHGYADYYDFTQLTNGAGTTGPQGQMEDIEGYYTDYLNRAGVDYLHQLSGYDAPFFAWFSHFAPHSVRKPGERGEDGHHPPALSPKYRAAAARGNAEFSQRAADYARSILDKPSFREKNISDKPALLQRQEMSSKAKVRRFVEARAGALASVDDAVAAYVDQLRRDGELDNTYIVFITDNGYLLGEHRRYGKILPYEETLRMPMLARGPGIAAGTRTNQVATTIDLAATFLDLAGARADEPIDGVSIVPMLHGKTNRNPHQDGVLIQGGAVKSETGKTGWYYRGVRTDRYSYARYFDGIVELYDLKRDPYQLKSVAGKRRYAALQAELDRRTTVLSTCRGPEQCNRKFGDLPRVK